MKAYRKYLDTVDFDYVISEFNRIAADVQKITHYQGEPEIILMVYEHPRIHCAERPVLRGWFNDHNYDLPE